MQVFCSVQPHRPLTHAAPDVKHKLARPLLHYSQQCHASGAAARATAAPPPPETGLFPCPPTGGRFRIGAV